MATVGKYYAEFIAKMDGFMGPLKLAQRDLKAFENRVKPLKDSLSQIGTVAGVAAGAIAAIGGGLAYMYKRSINAADAFSDMSEELGIGVEKLSAFAYAADQQDIGIDTMRMSLKKLELAMHGVFGEEEKAEAKLESHFKYTSKHAQDLAAIGSAVKNPFAELGISPNDLEPMKKMEQVLAKLKTISDVPTRESIAVKLFGKDGIVMLKLAGKDLDALYAKAKKHGAIFTQEDADKASDFNAAIKEAESSFQGIFNEWVRAGSLTKLTQAVIKIADALDRIAPKAAAVFNGAVDFASESTGSLMSSGFALGGLGGGIAGGLFGAGKSMLGLNAPAAGASAGAGGAGSRPAGIPMIVNFNISGNTSESMRRLTRDEVAPMILEMLTGNTGGFRDATQGALAK